ncbi:MAG: hypothetical protein V7631_768 [Massilia sp.]|jgi:hypothetical protein
MQAFSPNSPALRAQLETQADFFNQLSRHVFESLGQLSELNMHTARQLIDDGIKLGRSLAACGDPFQMVAVTMREAQPAAEHWRNWQGAMMRVLASSGATLAHDANDGSWQAARSAAGAQST